MPCISWCAPTVARGRSIPRSSRRSWSPSGAAELEESSALIGLASVTNLGYPDGEFVDSDAFRRSLGRMGAATAARGRVRPRPDGDVLRAGVLQPSRPSHRRRRPCWMPWPPRPLSRCTFPTPVPAHQVATVLLSGTLEPDEWVDVSETIECKAAAVECHRTQFAEPGGWAGEAVRRRAEEEGRRAGVPFAEGFRRLTLRG